MNPFSVFRSQSQRQQARQSTLQPLPKSPPLRPTRSRFSEYSTPGVENSAWSSHDFMLGAGMVLIQRNTHKIVMVYETKEKYWFFPRGRKDVGESLEQTALREAYEESGYRAEFLPLLNPTRQPTAPNTQYHELNTEPIFMTIASWSPKTRNGRVYDNGGEYLTTWYVGEIPEDAVHETGTGMPDEQNFQSDLLTYEQASKCVCGQENLVLQYAWNTYCNTLRTLARPSRI
ncbi:hypothetical protein CPB84DRAFT_1815380 [Gymnopilus junonius]|uniref:Nudix hydrolase domain-containing protein n=1 Tax=Gymnopilus junonius TaxID=109634 RepID=A0A9P5TM53_GYMJU|nr:hypothetical protein CPB84DRAFT_1815380 [Gymnopilus junonius]